MRYSTRTKALARAWRLALMALMLWSAAGCEESPHPSAAAQPAPQGEPQDAPLRVITLAPALTQMLVDLGQAHLLVGIAQHDLAAPAGLPVVGNFNQVQTEAVVQLKPTHVLAMKPQAGLPSRLQELAEAGRFRLVAYPYPTTIQAVLDILARPASEQQAASSKDAAEPVGRLIGKAEEAQALRGKIESQLAALRRLTAGRQRPATLVAFGLEPVVMASGPGTVNDELLAIAGGRNAAAGMAVTAPTFNREALLALEPQVILLLIPGAPPLREDDPRLGVLRGLPIPAVREGRVHLLN
ncbi:MAG TPA: ABC transporter substrate-binding protein, partial [Phycisphaeraceae bacterium]